MRTLSLLEKVDVLEAALWSQAHRRWWWWRWVAVYDAAYCFDAWLMMVIAMIVMLVLVLVLVAVWI